MIGYLLVGLAALATTLALTPLVRFAVQRLGIIDHPSDRKVHARPTPTLGGLALFVGVGAATAAAFYLPDLRDAFTRSSELLGIALGAVVIFALGSIDDVRELPAPVKLSGQVFAAGVLFLAGVKMRFILLPNGNQVNLSEDVSVLVTVLWLVAMINAVNLVDGLDGLAAGIVAIAAASFFVFSFQLSEEMRAHPAPAPLLTIAVVGATLGFLRFNFHPATIFMGDSGAMLLGLLLGGATVIGIGQAPAGIYTGLAEGADVALPASQIPTSTVFLSYFPLLIPLAVLAIPLLDAVFAVIRRTRRRRSLFQADKEHLHHRLMDLGHGHRQAVIVMYLWSALAAGAGLGFTFLGDEALVFALPVAVAAIVLYTLFPVLTRALQERLSL